MTLCRRVPGAFLLALLLFLTCGAASLRAQAPPPPGFLAEHYDVSASLDPIGQTISAVAKVDFRAAEASSSVRVELHPNLNVTDVRTPDGKSLSFDRDSQNPMILTVVLPSPVGAGGRATLTYTYAGILANEENSPVQGVRMASTIKDSTYLWLPARWFPLTNFPSNRYTATFRLNVPDTFAVAGSGKSSAPAPVAAKSPAQVGRLLYTFQCGNAAPHGTFVAGNFQLNPQPAEGINVAVYAPPAAPGKPQGFASDVARSSTIFFDLFGAPPV